MNLEKALQYVTHHSETIIQWLFFSILVLTGLLIARSLFGKKSIHSQGTAAASVDTTEIQSFLQKIMDQTAKLEAMPLGGMSQAIASSVDSQVQALKLDLASREAEIATLKQGGQPGPSGDADELNARIKELEGKLAEYEVLEDDIADLTLFKDENARLKAEVEQLKAGGAVSAPADPSALSEAAAVMEEELKLTETGDPIKDFETAMKLEKKLTGTDSAAKAEDPIAMPESEPEPVAAATAVEPELTNQTEPEPPLAQPAAPAPPPIQAEADDLFAEFAKNTEIDPVVASPDLDTEKMMAEMAALAEVPPETLDGSGLHDETIDTEKMAAEASTLSKP